MWSFQIPQALQKSSRPRFHKTAKEYLDCTLCKEYSPQNSYGWWKKSCTSWYSKYPIIYKVFYIPGDAGFLPSTVCPLKTSGWKTTSFLKWPLFEALSLVCGGVTHESLLVFSKLIFFQAWLGSCCWGVVVSFLGSMVSCELSSDQLTLVVCCALGIMPPSCKGIRQASIRIPLWTHQKNGSHKGFWTWLPLRCAGVFEVDFNHCWGVVVSFLGSMFFLAKSSMRAFQ